MSLHSNVHPLVSCQSPRVNISWFMNYLVLRNGNDQCLTSEASIFEDAIIWLGTESGFLFQYSAGKSSNIHLSKFAPSPQISTHTALFSRLKSALQRIISLKKPQTEQPMRDQVGILNMCAQVAKKAEDFLSLIFPKWLFLMKPKSSK